jgi:voltage-gated potassium channel
MSEKERREKRIVDLQRLEILEQIENWAELPLFVLGLVWLGLLVAEFVWGYTQDTVFVGIWIIFIIDFLIRFSLAPHKVAFLRRNVLGILSLILPVFRVFAVFRLIRIMRLSQTVNSIRLLRLLTSLNRGMRALGAALGRRGLGYVIAATILVIIGGSAGMFVFEGGSADGLISYPMALWWTAMLITTIGSDYWPVTTEGRIIALVLSLYALGIFGYVAAALASFFVGKAAESGEGDLASGKAIRDLTTEIKALRAEIEQLSLQRRGDDSGPPPT